MVSATANSDSSDIRVYDTLQVATTATAVATVQKKVKKIVDEEGVKVKVTTAATATAADCANCATIVINWYFALEFWFGFNGFINCYHCSYCCRATELVSLDDLSRVSVGRMVDRSIWQSRFDHMTDRPFDRLHFQSLSSIILKEIQE